MPDRAVPAPKTVKLPCSTYGHLTQSLRQLDRTLNPPSGVAASVGDARMHLTAILLLLGLVEHPVTRALPAAEEWWFTVEGATANVGNPCRAVPASLHRGRYCRMLARLADPDDAAALTAVLNGPELVRYAGRLALVRTPRGLHSEHLEAVQRDLVSEGLTFPESHDGWTAISPEPAGWPPTYGASWNLIGPDGETRLTGAGYPAIRLFLRAAPLALSPLSSVSRLPSGGLS